MDKKGELERPESAGDFLRRLGTDGSKWAKELCGKFSAIPEDDALGWCCNMIEAGRNAERNYVNEAERAKVHNLEEMLQNYINEKIGAQIKIAALSAQVEILERIIQKGLNNANS